VKPRFRPVFSVSVTCIEKNQSLQKTIDGAGGGT
jgi:hypothetical protein